MLRFLSIFFFLIFSNMLEAQEQKIVKDSTEKVYKEIEAYSQKSKFTRFVHKLVFKSGNGRQTSQTGQKPIRRLYKKYEGKIIRKIHIDTYDPFGHSETDTAKKPKRISEKVGNALHIKSKDFTIRNLLLIKEGQILDSILMNESERLIRSQRYVRRVLFESQLVENSKDSVDVFIRVLDSWSLVPNISPSASRTTFDLTERNFMGLGHQWDNRLRQNFTDGKNAYSTSYIIPNIKNTYIRSEILYDIDIYNNYRKAVVLERPFYSPLTRWAGGIMIDQVFKTDSLRNASGELSPQQFKFNTQDYWAGYAFQLFKGTDATSRFTNMVFKARYMNRDYLRAPGIQYDSLNYFSNERLYLFSTGVTSRRFVQDKFIFNYNIVEDIPIGKIYSITGGYQVKNFMSSPYFGARIGYGNFYQWGYLSTNLEYGTFYRNSKTERGAVSFEVSYFTNLLMIGKWRIRQFVKSDIAFGLNRMNYFADELTLNEEDEGIQGFYSRDLTGTKKVLLTFQTQTYSPWDLAGFRVNPFLNFSIGMLGNETTQFKNSRAYSKIGLGVLINNDYLVFNSFQISFSYYPSIPDMGRNIFDTNTFSTSDFGFQDFEVGKPRTVRYR